MAAGLLRATVTFDVTNTLMTTKGSIGQIYARFGRQFGLQVNEQLLNQAFRSAFKKTAAEFPNFGYHSGHTSLQWWTIVIRRTFQDSGVSFSELRNVLEPLAAHAFDEFKTSNCWQLASESVPKILEKVREHAHVVGVISNFDERLETVLESLGLRHHFDFVLASRVVGIEKPAGAIFARALDFAGLSEDQCRQELSLCVHVGDDWQNDVEGPLGSSSTWKVVWLQGTKPSKIIQSLPPQQNPRFSAVKNLTELPDALSTFSERMKATVSPL